MAKKIKTIDDLLINITPERQAEIDAMMETHMEWHDAHPDYDERYGTDKSYWLQEIIDKGFKPVGITVMICEETIIMETTKEIEEAWEIFKPEGWWYTINEWEKRREEYVKTMYNGDEDKAPLVYCLNDKYNKRIK